MFKVLCSLAVISASLFASHYNQPYGQYAQPQQMNRPYQPPQPQYDVPQVYAPQPGMISPQAGMGQMGMQSFAPQQMAAMTEAEARRLGELHKSWCSMNTHLCTNVFGYNVPTKELEKYAGAGTQMKLTEEQARKLADVHKGWCAMNPSLCEPIFGHVLPKKAEYERIQGAGTFDKDIR